MIIPEAGVSDEDTINTEVHMEWRVLSSGNAKAHSENVERAAGC